MRKVNYVLLNAASNVNQTSGKIDTNQMVSISALANFTNGDEAGSVKWQASNDPCPDSIQPNTFTPTNWADVPNQSATITAGGSALLTITQCSYRWLRIVWTHTSGGAANKVVNVSIMGLSV